MNKSNGQSMGCILKWLKMSVDEPSLLSGIPIGIRLDRFLSHISLALYLHI